MGKLVNRVHALKLGRYKVWQARIQSYLGIMSFVMVFYLYTLQLPLGLPWYVWIIMMGLLIPNLLLMDMTFVWPSEMEYGFKKNPRMLALEKNVQINNNILKKLEKKLL